MAKHYQLLKCVSLLILAAVNETLELMKAWYDRFTAEDFDSLVQLYTSDCKVFDKRHRMGEGRECRYLIIVNFPIRFNWDFPLRGFAFS